MGEEWVFSQNIPRVINGIYAQRMLSGYAPPLVMHDSTIVKSIVSHNPVQSPHQPLVLHLRTRIVGSVPQVYRASYTAVQTG